MNKWLILNSIFLIFIFLYFYFAKIHFLPQANFVIGTASGYAPFVTLDHNGNYEGFDIDIASCIAQKMDKNLVIKDYGSMGPLFLALEQGQVDAVIWGLSITSARLNSVAMIQYGGHDVSSYPLVFWKKKDNQLIQSLDDCRGMRICVESGSVQETILDRYPQIEKVYVDRVDDALLNIHYQKSDAAFVESAIAQKFYRAYPNEIQIVAIPLKDNDCEKGIGIAIKHTNQILIKQLGVIIKQLFQEGIIEFYEQKWDIS